MFFNKLANVHRLQINLSQSNIYDNSSIEYSESWGQSDFHQSTNLCKINLSKNIKLWYNSYTKTFDANKLFFPKIITFSLCFENISFAGQDPPFFHAVSSCRRKKRRKFGTHRPDERRDLPPGFVVSARSRNLRHPSSFDTHSHAIVPELIRLNARLVTREPRSNLITIVALNIPQVIDTIRVDYVAAHVPSFRA